MQISLKTRLALFSSLIAIALTILASLGSQFLAFRDLQALLEQQQSSQVKLVAEQLDTKFEDRSEMLRHLVAELQGKFPSSPSHANAILHSLPLPLAFDNLFFIDPKGNVDYSTAPLGAQRLNVSDRAYFQEALRTRDVVISDPVYSRSSHTPMVYMVAPVIAADGRVVGMLGGALNLLKPNFLGRIAHHRIGVTGYYCLVSGGPRALYVMHRDTAQLGKAAHLTGENCGEQMQPSRYEFLAPNAALVSRYILQSTGWELVAVVPANEAYAPLRAMHTRMKTIAIVVAAIAGVAAWLATWYLLAPLSRLRDVVQRSHEDDAAYESLVLQRNDEIGEVGREFASLMSQLNLQNDALRRSEAELRAGELRMRNIADHLPSLVAYLDRNERYVFNNHAYEREFGRPAAELRGMHIRDLLGEEAYQRLQPYLRRAFAGEEISFETSELVQGGGMLWTEALYQPEWNADHTEVVGIHILVRDITAEKAEVERLDALTQLDHLTGIANRKGFDRRLAVAVDDANLARIPFALLYLDLDHFKTVNDTYGHACGDALLQTFSMQILGCIRKTDTVARLGGDEFAIVIDGINHPEQVTRVARDILEATRMPFVFGTQIIPMGVSIGIALSQPEHNTVDDIKARADAALYRAKQNGRHQFAVDGDASTAA
ncbi:diguanylate cyclase domain-containing protein [Imbroritus primus]|uniref:diguanylate cyclase domain-containing protein n=1 Tax=Imbroritus primus TaxID=3058603 RepID=UPI003D161D21